MVLDAEGTNLLLLSKLALDFGLFATEEPNERPQALWKDSVVRSNLNEFFINAAFSEAEKAAIQVTEVDNSAAQGFAPWKNSSDITMDQIFLLSYQEVLRYLPNENDRKCEPCSLLKAIASVPESGYVWWWLRSPGSTAEYATCVLDNGMLSSGVNVNRGCGYRPALWVDASVISLPIIDK